MDGVREYSIKLLELVDSGLLEVRQVLGNLVYNFLSEDQVKDFCETEYSEEFEGGDE